MKILSKLQVFILLFGICFSLHAQFRLPKFLSDGMVLQRDVETKIWGWSNPMDNITLSFLDSVYNTKADETGKWEVKIAESKPGGPYVMVIQGSDTLTISNILIGDVWVCAGQSNIEVNMKRVKPLYEKEIAESENNFIRQFYVPRKYDFNELKDDYEFGSWISVNPETIMDFTAVGYFFGKKLNLEFDVPIGIVNSGLGGAPIQSFMSLESLKPFPNDYNEAVKFQDGKLIEKIIEDDKNRIGNWYKKLRCKDEGFKDVSKYWVKNDLITEDWGEFSIPGFWNDSDIGFMNGVVWFRKEFDIPENLSGIEAKLLMGTIVDADSVYVNEQFVGTTSYQYPPRRYTVPSGLLKSGKNTIVVRVISNKGRAGFINEKPYEIVFNDTIIDLKGKWKYKVGAVMDPLGDQTFIRWKPTGLFNSMIHPLTHYPIKGVLWYQGESNASTPNTYNDLLSIMIEDWRKYWGKEDMPFVYAQLPNFMSPKVEPTESGWAELREAQLKTLSVPNTAMSVNIDLGEWNDIHPLNKKDVGERLALGAKYIAYSQKDVIYSGPIYKSSVIKENKIIISFTNIGSGLICKDDDVLSEFAIAGADKKFVWANASIDDDKVIVWSDSVKEPLYVRYAWADNPDKANLYNKEGLPASPFRTDK